MNYYGLSASVVICPSFEIQCSVMLQGITMHASLTEIPEMNFSYSVIKSEKFVCSVLWSLMSSACILRHICKAVQCLVIGFLCVFLKNSILPVGNICQNMN